MPGQIETVPIDTLIPHPENYRHGDVDSIRESIRANEFYGVVVVQASTRHICAGNHRWEAAKLEGLTEIRAELLDIDDATARRILAADNGTSDRATNDNRLLAELLADVRETSTIGLAGSGYDDSTLDRLLKDFASEDNAGQDNDVDTTPAEPDAVTKRVTRGQIWTVGPHRLMCGDSRDPADVSALLAGAVVNLAVTSPPYAQQREYDAESGFTPIHPDDYVEWFAPVAACVATHLADDGSWLVNIKPSAAELDTSLYVHDLVAAHVRQWGWHLATEFCWERNGVPKQPVLRLKNQFEPIYQFVQGRWKFRPENVRHLTQDAIVAFGPGRGNTSWADPESGVVSQGQKGDLFEGQRMRRKHLKPSPTGGIDEKTQGHGYADIGDGRGNGWAYPGNRLPTFAGTHEATGHAAAYPVGLPAFLARLFTDHGDVVYDPFIGSGSTILAAHNTGRVGYGMELSADYCDITLDRLERHTGLTPTLIP